MDYESYKILFEEYIKPLTTELKKLNSTIAQISLFLETSKKNE